MQTDISSSSICVIYRSVSVRFDALAAHCPPANHTHCLSGTTDFPLDFHFASGETESYRIVSFHFVSLCWKHIENNFIWTPLEPKRIDRETQSTLQIGLIICMSLIIIASPASTSLWWWWCWWWILLLSLSPLSIQKASLNYQQKTDKQKEKFAKSFYRFSLSQLWIVQNFIAFNLVSFNFMTCPENKTITNKTWLHISHLGLFNQP